MSGVRFNVRAKVRAQHRLLSRKAGLNRPIDSSDLDKTGFGRLNLIAGADLKVVKLRQIASAVSADRTRLPRSVTP